MNIQEELKKLMGTLLIILIMTGLNLNYDGNNISVTVFGYENKLVFPVHISNQTF